MLSKRMSLKKVRIVEKVPVKIDDELEAILDNINGKLIQLTKHLVNEPTTWSCQSLFT